MGRRAALNGSGIGAPEGLQGSSATAHSGPHGSLDGAEPTWWGPWTAERCPRHGLAAPGVPPSNAPGDGSGVAVLTPLFDCSSEGWFASHSNGRITYANHEFKRLVGLARPVGTDFARIVAPEARTGVERSFRHVGSGRAPQHRSIVPVIVADKPEAFTLALQRVEDTCQVPSVVGLLARPSARRPDDDLPGVDREEIIDRALGRIAGQVLAVLDDGAQFAAGTTPLAPLVFDALSPRQHEVLDLVLEGCSHKEIGRRLYISLHTVRNHLSTIYRRLGVHSEPELIAFCRARQAHPTARRG